MATVAQTTPPSKVFYAHYFDEPGAVVKQAGSLYFISESDEVIEVEISTLNFLTVLGQMQLADAQHIADLLNGGPAGVACSRQEGVR
jgi:hypothetical protein